MRTKAIALDDFEELIWHRPPETDAHCEQARNPYRQRACQWRWEKWRYPDLRISDFVSRAALGSNCKISKELILRSRGLIDRSKQIIRDYRIHHLLLNDKRLLQ
jgi:hypothetical protein